VLPESSCQELNKLHLDANRVFGEVKRIRRARDLSFFEDADLNCLKCESLTVLIKHLLAGHQGHPCPAGSRPIVTGPAPACASAQRSPLIALGPFDFFRRVV
jgi:hypothetical protein